MLKEINIAEQLPQLDFKFKLLYYNVLPVFINPTKPLIVNTPRYQVLPSSSFHPSQTGKHTRTIKRKKTYMKNLREYLASDSKEAAPSHEQSFQHKVT